MRETNNEGISNFFTIVCSRKRTLSPALSDLIETNSIIQRHSRDRFR